VKPSPSFAFGLLLALSLAGKLAANQAAAGPDPRRFDAEAAAMLRAAGFAAAVEHRPFGSLLHGGKSGCRLILAEYDPHGTFAELLRELAAPVGPLRFAWRGRVYTAAPRTQALVHFYLWRELRRVRIAAARAPLAAWAASPGCDTRSLDWNRLATLPV
jgi:hypothetical protein